MRKMKDSGIEWIGQIPTEWRVHPARFAFSENKKKNTEGLVTKALQFKFGTIIPKNNFDADEDNYVADTITNYTIVEPRMIMINGLNLNYDLKSLRVGMVRENGVITSAYLSLIPDETIIDAEFATYLFKGYEAKMAFHNMGAGIRKTLGFKEFKSQPILLPSLQEQQRIVRYLDDKLTEIDAAIEKTKATIEEYKKLKQSIITEAVTKGIRGDRPMKDSGIEWIGEIPVEWTIGKVGYFFDIQLGKMLQPQKESEEDTLEHYLCAANVGGNCFKLSSIKEMWFKPNEKSTYEVSNGDLLVVEGGDIASCDIVRECISPLYIQNALHRVRAKSGNDIRFLKYWLWFAKGIGHINLICNKATIAHFSKEKFIALPYIIATGEENEISDYLDKKCAEIDTLIARKMALLEEMESYKQSIIYEYVTGKKDCQSMEKAETVVVIYPYFPAVLSTDKARFAQAILVSRILDKCRTKMGRVKLEKMLYTIENSIGFDFETQYVREAAGPLDSSIYECERIISRRNKWYTLNSSKYGVFYTPTKESGKYKKYYDKYFGEYDTEIDRIINIFMNFDADQSEIIATLFAAWNDAIIEKKQASDEEIVEDVLNNWNESKKRFSKDIWLRAIAQMHKDNLVPKGYGKHTVIKD